MPLKRLASFRNDVLIEERPLLALEHLESWTGGMVSSAELGRAESGSAGAAAVEPGDVLFGKLRPYLAKGITVTEPLAASTELICMRPQPNVDPRWLGYVTRSQRFVEWSVATSEGTKMPRTSWEKLGAFEVQKPPLAEQRAIADYLDAETARIDALIAKKRQLIHLLEQRRWRTFDELAVKASTDLVSLRRVLTFLTDGPFGSAFSSADYVEAGLAVVRLGNIGFAEFRGGEMAYLPLERKAEFSRYRVRGGDLLAAALGDERSHAGRACAAPDLGPAIVKGKCFCGHVDEQVADVEYVALACSSPSAAERFRLGAQGSTRQMINMEIFKSLRIPLPTLDQQRNVVATVKEMWQSQDEALQIARRQLDLLADHRRATIAAAVTGEVRASSVP